MDFLFSGAWFTEAHRKENILIIFSQCDKMNIFTCQDLNAVSQHTDFCFGISVWTEIIQRFFFFFLLAFNRLYFFDTILLIRCHY